MIVINLGFMFFFLFIVYLKDFLKIYKLIENIFLVNKLKLFYFLVFFLNCENNC